MASGYNYNRYGDNLARKKRRRFFLKISLAFLAFIILSGSVIYLLFFSSVMKVENIEIKGLSTISSSDILPVIDSFTKQKYLGLETMKNILFFDEESLKRNILAAFPVIQEAELSKEYPHKIYINIKERTPLGTWCSGEDGSTPLTTSCRYFDASGALWGNALKSSGSLLLTIEDMRPDEKYDTLDKSILEPVSKAVSGLDGLGINISDITILPEGIGDFRVGTSGGYYILFSIQSDVTSQIKILKILLDEKGDEFQPLYIDLRIDGRIYYK